MLQSMQNTPVTPTQFLCKLLLFACVVWSVVLLATANISSLLATISQLSYVPLHIMIRFDWSCDREREWFVDLISRFTFFSFDQVSTQKAHFTLHRKLQLSKHRAWYLMAWPVQYLSSLTTVDVSGIGLASDLDAADATCLSRSRCRLWASCAAPCLLILVSRFAGADNGNKQQTQLGINACIAIINPHDGILTTHQRRERLADR